MDKENKKTGRKGKLSFYAEMILMAMLPMILATVITTGYIVSKSQDEISTTMQNYMYSLAVAKGEGLTNKITALGTAAGLSEETLTAYCSDVAVKDVDSSYCYVADASATMLWHPTAEKIGEPVTNEVIQGVCGKMSQGETVQPDVVEYVFNGAVKYASYYVDPDDNFVLVISADEDDVLAGAEAIKNRGYMIAALMIVIFLIVAIISANIIVKPLKKVKDELSTIADGNLTNKFEITSVIHEVEDIIESTQTLQHSMAKALGIVNTESDSLSGAIENVSERIGNSVGGVAQINAAVGEVAETSQHVAEEAQILNQKTLEMGDAIETIYQSIGALQEASARIDTINNEANGSMETVIKSGQESVDAVHGIADKIDETNAAVQKITECVKMITDISSQTNLLSLNASIEAARAGEAGKGFAVVAEEIRQLADDSAASAKEIEDIIAEVTALSDSTVQAAKAVFDVIEGEQESVRNTQTKFGELSNAVEDSLKSINEIQTMSHGLTQIKEELVSSTTELSAVSEELGASAEEVSASCTTVTTECEGAAAETHDMASSKAGLQKAIAKFEI